MITLLFLLPDSGKGKYKLHPAFAHLAMPEEVWMTKGNMTQLCRSNHPK